MMANDLQATPAADVRPLQLRKPRNWQPPASELRSQGMAGVSWPSVPDRHNRTERTINVVTDRSDRMSGIW